ncbi:MAG: EthD domain-containing protein [Dehalococcoidia bacterium]
MIKTIALLKRKPGISREEFARHYEEVHAPMAIKLLTVFRKYVRNHVVEVPGVEGPDFDCVSEFWFDSVEDAMEVQEILQSDAARELREDEASFIDSSKTVSFMVDERISEI